MISEVTINFFVGLILGATIMHYGIKTGKKLGCDPK